ncbi:hypothetical protein [Sphingomonas segetis]|jgi:hypothetical protein|nr:hypothetical protein [Sphingomonas segetis]
MSVKQLTLRKITKGAGAVVLGLVAVDLVATLVTFALGVEFFRR